MTRYGGIRIGRNNFTWKGCLILFTAVMLVCIAFWFGVGYVLFHVLRKHW